MLYRVSPFFELRWNIFEEPFQKCDDGVSFRDVLVENDAAILHQNGPVGRLEDDVVLRIAGGDLLLYFLREIVCCVFRLPKAMREPVLVDKSAIDSDWMTAVFSDAPFRNKFPAELPAAMLQESLKRGANCALMRDSNC